MSTIGWEVVLGIVNGVTLEGVNQVRPLAENLAFGCNEGRRWAAECIAAKVEASRDAGLPSLAVALRFRR